MKIYVITPARDTERHPDSCAVLERAALRFQCLTAIAGADGRDFFETIDADQYQLHTGHPPSNREIGAYASHLYLWNLCVALNEPIVVIEDGIVLDRALIPALRAVEMLIERYGLIRLDGRTCPAGCAPVDSTGSFTLASCPHQPLGAGCYAVAPSTARALIRGSRVLVGPVDFFLQQSRLHGCASFTMWPPGAVHLDPRCDGTTSRGSACPG